MNSFEAGVIRKIVYPLWVRRDHPRYAKSRQQGKSQQFYNDEELRDLQNRLLRQQLMHAYTNIPYYKARFDAIDLTPLDIKSIDDLRHIPVLTKRDIQESGRHLLARNVPPDLRVQNKTGGSTGSPLQFWVDKARFDMRRASTDRHNEWAGVRPGDLCAQLWGAVIDTGTTPQVGLPWRQRALHREITLNTAAISEAGLLRFVSVLRRYRPNVLIAYAQSAVMFANFCVEHKLHDIRFRSIITTAEVLFDHQRSAIEEAFGGKVFNRYGCRELSVIASECEYHTGMHVNADSLIVEVDSRASSPSGPGRLLVTDLLNLSMPLIRYEIGDEATWSHEPPCPCGRSLPRLTRIEGRTTDFLRLPSGATISGPALTLVHADMIDVKQIQYVQGDEQSVTVRIVPGTTYSPQTKLEVLRRLQPYFKDTLRLDIQIVSKIDKEVSGKYRFVKNELSAPLTGTRVGLLR
jgi:phenylacetate-CoA ligase